MTTPIPLPHFTAEILSVYEASRYAPKTHRRVKQVLRQLQALEGVATTADLTTPNMARFVESRGPRANPNTTNGLLGALRVCCNYAIEHGYLERPPVWKRLRLRPRKPTLNRPLTYNQAALLLDRLRDKAADWVGARLYALYCTILLTGLRRDEALYAHIEDVDLKARSLRVVERARRLKTEGSERTVPLPLALCEVLSLWIPQLDADELPWLFPGVRRLGPWTGGMPGSRAIDRLNHVAALVGIKHVTWHGLRHTFGTQALLKFDQPLWVVQRVMGHSDLRTTQRYLHLDDHERLAASVAAIAYPLPV